MAGLEHILQIELISNENTDMIRHDAVSLIFCVHGDMRMACGSEDISLKKDQFYIINSRTWVKISSGKTYFAAIFYIPLEQFNKIGIDAHVKFKNQTDINSENSKRFAVLLRNTLMLQNSDRWQDKIKEQHYQWMVLQELIENYCIRDEIRIASDSDKGRIQMIKAYLNENYKQQISLLDLADYCHLSVPYLSKYIKQHMEVGFNEYLNRIRIFHASDLLVKSDASVTQIAFDQGFSSLSSFNRVFKESFGMTPMEYRKQNEALREEQAQARRQKLLKAEENRRLLKLYLSEIGETIPDYTYRVEYDVDMEKYQTYCPTWNRLWNLGSAEELLRADVQEHILYLKQEFKFEQVHIWNLFSEEMFIDLSRDSGFNFNKVEMVLDFITGHGMIPWIDLGFHPDRLYGKNEFVHYKARKSAYENVDKYTVLIDEFLTHMIERYGLDAVSGWHFEVSKDDRLFMFACDAFFDLFERVVLCIRRHILGACIGGGAIFAYDHMEMFESFVAGWTHRECRPDFISIWLYPYEMVKDDTMKKIMLVSDNVDYIRNKLDAANVIMSRFDIQIPVYVTQWDLSLSCRNFINESCYRAVYVLRNLVDSVGKTKAMAGLGNTDLLCDYYDSSESIFGGNGLISKNKIKKPVFFAYEFLCALKPYMIFHNEHCIVTTDGQNNFAVILWYEARIDRSYMHSHNEDIGAEELQYLFEEELLELNIHLDHIANGQYQQKLRALSPLHGGLMGNWKRLGFKASLTKEELQYLTSVSVPTLEYENITVVDELILLNARLHTNEMRLYEIEKIR